MLLNLSVNHTMEEDNVKNEEEGFNTGPLLSVKKQHLGAY